MRWIDSAESERAAPLAQHVLEQESLADARRSAQQDDPRFAAELVDEFGAGPQVFLARIQKIWIRAQTEGKLVETEKLRVHVLSPEAVLPVDCRPRRPQEPAARRHA